MFLVIITGLIVGTTAAFNPIYSLMLFGVAVALTLCIYFPRTYVILSILFVILVPKLAVMSIPGTYVAIRGEDALIALFVLRSLIVALLSKTNSKISNIALRNIVFAFSLYIAWCLIAVLMGLSHGYIKNPLLGFMFLFRKVEYFSLMYFGIVYFNKSKNNSKFLLLIDFCVILLLAVGIMQKFNLIGAYSLGQYKPIASDRIMSTFSGAYEYAGFLLLITPIYIHKMLNNKYKLLWVGYLFIIAYSLLITESRISLVAYFGIFLIGCINLIKRNIKKLLIFGYILITIVVTGVLLQSFIQAGKTKSLERFDTLNAPAMWQETLYAWNMRDYETFLLNGPQLYFTGTDLSYSLRMSKWMNYIDGVVHHPFVGLGLSTTGEAVDGNFIRILAESGIIGFLLWAFVMFRIYRFAKNLVKQNKIEGTIVHLGLIALLLSAIFIDVFEASKVAMVFWLFVGWMITQYNRNTQDTK